MILKDNPVLRIDISIKVKKLLKKLHDISYWLGLMAICEYI